MQKIRLGFSPCPNDTFIFDALVNGKIPSNGLEFECHIADVEQLNTMAFNGLLDVTKCSYHAYAHLYQQYYLLDAGSALGTGVGPLLIAKDSKRFTNNPSPSIAIPGKYTTAAFLYKSAFGDKGNSSEVLFSEIEDAVLQNRFDAGVIIHESRFTYAHKGLQLIADLGSLWEEKHSLPIPLGGIIGHRRLGKELASQVSALIHTSLQFAFNNPGSSADFIRCNAVELAPEVVSKHINLYVNHYSLSLGYKGRQAVEYMLKNINGSNYLPQYFEIR